MEQIKFDNLQSNWVLKIVVIVSLLCIVFGGFEIIEFQNPRINKGIRTIGYLSQTIYFTRMFWYKNYVQWNKKGLLIRTNSFWGKSIAFTAITTTQLENNVLTIHKTNGDCNVFDLKTIDPNDSKRLMDIIKQHTY
jgi:hypothetical protein